MDIEEFQKKNKPIGRRSRLEPFREGILELKNNGYANFQIAEWLALNGINVSQQTVRQFVKTQKEEKKKEKNPKNEREKTQNRENHYQTINNKKDTQQTKNPSAVNSPQTETKKPTASSLPDIAKKLPDDFVNPLEEVMEKYKKEREENHRKDTLGWNSVPDLEKIYGKKK